MFHIIFYILYFVLYSIGIVFIVSWYILKFCITTIILLLKSVLDKKEKITYAKIKENLDMRNILQYKNEQIELKNYKKTREFKLIEPNDLEYKMEVCKIQDLYKKLGFDVKVTNIKKNKYNTEYEVIFSRDINPYDIFQVSNLIIDQYSIDGVNIKKMKKENNRLTVSIPLEYKEIVE